MQLLSFTENGRASFGVSTPGGIVDLGRRLPDASSVDDLLAGPPELMLRAAEAAGDAPDVDPAAIRWLPPLTRPGKIICVGLNYAGHVSETGRQPNQKPTLFSRWADTHVGHLEPLLLPRASERFDFEGELAVVIGKPGRHIPEARAMAHVAGYSCYNDGSIRDWQKHSSQFLPGKNFAASGSFGPVLVTADAVPDYRALTLETRLNGKVMQQASLAQLIFDLPYLISYISSFTPLAPGDVIVSGTPEGVGAFREPPVWMRAGDVVEVEIAGIGLLSNPVAAEPERA